MPGEYQRQRNGWVFDHLSSQHFGITLRSYQRAIAEAIVDSVRTRAGRTFAVMMSRQSGKNELSAVIEAYLLCLYQRTGGQIVKASPTYRPQTVNSKLRLLARLPDWTGVQQREGYMVEVGAARCLFLSASPAANVVGATASLLLECDEAQSVDPDKWTRDFAPMAASTNATTVFWGTAWTDRTLLAQTVRQLREQEHADGVQRVFIVAADQVALEVPAYSLYLTGQVQRLGRDHPLIRSQYYLEEVQGAGGLFSAHRQAQMRGTHPRQTMPTPGKVYALLVDVGGADLGATADEGRTTEDDGRWTMDDGQSGLLLVARPSSATRDATALTVVEINVGTDDDRQTTKDDGMTDPLSSVLRPSSIVGGPSSDTERPSSSVHRPSSIVNGLPSYRVVDRRRWVGVPQTELYAQLLDLANLWGAWRVVVDATGLGAGLAQFLQRALGSRVMPVTLTSASKTSLGWGFLAAIDTGRFKDYADDGAPDTRQFWYEVDACEFEAGSTGSLRWGVWETPRDDGLVQRGHDDLLLSAALCVLLDDERGWGHGESQVTEPADVLAEVDAGGF